MLPRFLFFFFPSEINLRLIVRHSEGDWQMFLKGQF